ncbi:hypothetical protein MIB92_11850 [Aestuariirhabdus sp. Z084]|uniref:hypothetical protein n=1 Tax=Aestuariirhabdus haliotis TaxID=2918751 RepID=UPI00201B3C1B|nr:hypothetical protein [Aestuariirhabdus haliotis]MCL6416345.1 hypothetical protein [Aestuariirhabdus haliotis]MCL6420334.1 hypothetical protein [Aestuariirhabdus haliotis]
MNREEAKALEAEALETLKDNDLPPGYREAVRDGLADFKCYFRRHHKEGTEKTAILLRSYLVKCRHFHINAATTRNKAFSQPPRPSRPRMDKPPPTPGAADRLLTW